MSHLGNKPLKLAVILWTFVAVLFTSGVGYSQDDCNNLSNNMEWQAGMSNLIKKIQSNDVAEAKRLAASLSEICSTSPALNYLLGKLADAKNEKTDALYYYQKASEYTYLYAIEPNNAKKIWYERFLHEHPECRLRSGEDASSGGGFAIDDETKGEVEKAFMEKLLGGSDQVYYPMYQQEMRKLMWSGVGIAVAGIVFAGVGGGLVAKNSDLTYEDSEGFPKYKPNPVYQIGWASIGVGAALTITGIVLTGVYGYKYTHLSLNQSYSFELSPFGASFSMQF